MGKTMGKSEQSAMNPEYDHYFNIQLAGVYGAGKSSLLLRYADDTYTESYISTVDVNYKFKQLNVGGKVVKLKLNDENDNKNTPINNYFKTDCQARPAKFVMACYDVTNKQSFEILQERLNDIKDSDREKIILVGLKSDMKSRREVDYAMASQYASDKGIEHTECSAKNNDGVNDLFYNSALKLVNQFDPNFSEQAGSGQANERVFLLDDNLLTKLKSHITNDEVDPANTKKIAGKIPPAQMNSYLSAAYDGIYGQNTINRNQEQKFVEKAQNLIGASYERELSSTRRWARVKTFLFCLPIITIPFSVLFYNSRFKKHYEAQHFKTSVFDGNALTVFCNRKKQADNNSYCGVLNKADFLAKQRHSNSGYAYSYCKSDFFNENGELRKIQYAANNSGGECSIAMLSTSSQRDAMIEKNEQFFKKNGLGG